MASYSTWGAIKSSYNQDYFGGQRDNVLWHEKNARHGYKDLYGKFPKRPGLMNEMAYGMKEYFTGGGDRNAGNILNHNSTQRLKYGGSIFSTGGWREILHKTQKGPSPFPIKAIGARRSAMGTFGKFAMKAAWPIIGVGMFMHQASTEGVYAATKDAVMFGAGFGAAKWAFFKSGAALFNPLTIGVAATVGTVFAGRAALKAGRDYRKKLRQTSFGNAFQDTYGNAATIRQAGLAAIQSSKINGRNSLGAEASLLHL